jgi:hypothetical protein
MAVARLAGMIAYLSEQSEKQVHITVLVAYR